jgi:hypothetical protein
MAAHLAGGFADLFFGDACVLLLQAQAFLDQGFEDLAAFFLGLREGAHAGQPDLLGRVLDRLCQVSPSGRPADDFFSAVLLQFLDHGVPPVWVGMNGRTPGCAWRQTLGLARDAV